MLLDALGALRQAAETVRRQIPTGELTLAGVERLMQAADAVAAAAAGSSSGEKAPPSPPSSKQQEVRRRWARIARQNAREVRRASAAAE